jgi:hypothetical protein
MRVVVWNMGRQRDSWAELATLGPDVALVQEAVPPVGRGQVVYRPIGGSRPWGSAVVGFGTEVTEVTHARGRYNTADQHLHQTWPGSIAIATIGSDAQRLTLVSMYGMIDDGYADTTVHRQLSDLVPLLDDPSHEGHTLIGGDLNITTQWVGHQARYRYWELATFDRIRAFGLVDCLDRYRAAGPLPGCGCLDGEACRHIRTQQHPRSARPWQNDYVFASRQAADERVIGARVVDEVRFSALSGHFPLAVELR